MKQFDDLNKRTPYRETPQYVSQLVEQCAERAIEAHTHRTHMMRRSLKLAASVAAAVLLIVGIYGISNSSPSLDTATIIANAPSLDEVLNSLTEEETQALYTYSVDEIPEY